MVCPLGSLIALRAVTTDLMVVAFASLPLVNIFFKLKLR